ncbi:MAG: hypothetical protein LBO78_01985 [Rickettsiales bacterium]|jgi:hypothetical protein|nr:hypothetical protein [Rickettsiales bacterium]
MQTYDADPKIEQKLRDAEYVRQVFRECFLCPAGRFVLTYLARAYGIGDMVSDPAGFSRTLSGDAGGVHFNLGRFAVLSDIDDLVATDDNNENEGDENGE